MVLQITGRVKFKITLDPSTWIFDDRKVHLKDLKNVSSNTTINFEDHAEWNRQIIEGSTRPPTLKSEKQYKKTEMLEGTFAICLAPFLEYTEPHEDSNAKVKFTGENTLTLNYEDRHNFYAHFSKEGKRLYNDGMFDLLIVKNREIINNVTHVTEIEFI